MGVSAQEDASTFTSAGEINARPAWGGSRASPAAVPGPRRAAAPDAGKLLDEGEPAHGRFTPDLAKFVWAAVARLAHAELALHALALSRQALPRLSKPMGGAAFVNGFRSALSTGMTRLAVAVDTLQPMADAL